MSPTLESSNSTKPSRGAPTRAPVAKRRLVCASGTDFPLSWAVLVCAVGLLLKSPDAFLHPQFWAEDGREFFSSQAAEAWPFFHPYATYIHLIPRLVAKLASPFSPRWAPTIYTGFAWLIGSAALVSLRQLRLGRVPYLVVLAGVLLTPTNGESFGVITNVQSLLQFYLLSILARLGSGVPSRAPYARAIIAFVVGLTGPFGIFACAGAAGMIALSHAWHRRAPEQLSAPLRPNLELVGLGLAACIQLYFIATTPRLPAAEQTLKGALRLLSVIQLHWLSVEPLPRVLFRLLLLALIAGAFVLLKDARGRLLLLGICGFALLEYVGVLRKFPGEATQFTNHFEWGDRYFVLSKALCTWLCAIVVLEAKLKPRLRAVLLASVVAVPAILGRKFLVKPALPDLHWPEQARALESGEVTSVPINPPGWEASVPARAR